MSRFSLCQASISLGANAPLQALSFLLCLALGFAFSFVTLLYRIKSRPIERALVDLFATLLIGAGFIVCCEFFLDGKIELYGLLGYLLGLATIPAIFRASKRFHKTKKQKYSQKNSNLSQKDKKD